MRTRRAPKPRAPRPAVDCTRQAKQVWAAVYPGDPWPKGWRAVFKSSLTSSYGHCDYRAKTVALAKRVRTDVVQTLIHEFVHVRNPGLKHGVTFNRLVRSGAARIGIVDREPFLPEEAPPRRPTPKLIDRIKADPRVGEFVDEGSGGYWAYLKSGFERDGMHGVHEYTLREVAAALKDVDPCACEQCQEDAAPKSVAACAGPQTA